jgi:hypothetical protein
MEITKEQMAILVAKARQAGQLAEQVRILQYITDELEALRTPTINNIVELVSKDDTND